MSHVSEGKLHAYLDGALGHEAPSEAGRLEAHLRECADCRVRLERAARLREQAESILATGAARGVARPPFEEILHRAAAAAEGPATGGAGSASAGGPRPAPGGARVRRPIERVRSLAWAASVLLAVGVGWAARAYWSGGPERGQVALLQSREDAEEAADRLPGKGRELDRLASRPASQEAVERKEQAAGRQLPDRAVGADRPVGAQQRAGEAAASERVAAEEPAEVAGRIAKAAKPATESERDAAAGGARAKNAEQARRAAAGPVPTRVLEARLEDVRVSGGDGARPESDVWVPTEPTTAGAWIGGEALRVAELRLLDVSVSTRGGVRVLRTRQLLPSGRILELYQEADAARRGNEEARGDAAATEPPLDEEPSVLEGRVGGYRVRLVAPVALDSLRVLLSLVR
ncbi:MAG: zf-HC2 domain-containing protein [Gemmatimonadota bacterium]